LSLFLNLLIRNRFCATNTFVLGITDELADKFEGVDVAVGHQVESHHGGLKPIAASLPLDHAQIQAGFEQMDSAGIARARKGHASQHPERM